MSPEEDDAGIDDQDFMGVIVAPLNCYVGLSEWGTGRGTQERFEGAVDLVEYEVRKFFSLLLKGNPNVQSLLFTKTEHICYASEAGRWLIRYRDWFSSKRAFRAYLGYAHSQASKMEKAIYKGFLSEKRKELVAKFGYDTKHAAHAIRIMRMGIEFLRTGNLIVDRTLVDAHQLIAIKRGMWNRGQVVAELAELTQELHTAYRQSHLPEEPETAKVEEMLSDIILDYHDLVCE